MSASTGHFDHVPPCDNKFVGYIFGSAGECVTFPLMVYQISAKQQQRQKTGKGSFKAGADTGVGRSDFAPP